MSRVLNIITGLGDGGAEATLCRLCCHDKENIHFVLSLTGHGKYYSVLKDNSIHVLSVDFKKHPFVSIFHLVKAIKVIKPDVVQTWMYHADFLGGIAARVAGIKNIYWGVHNTILEKGTSKFSTRIIAKINAVLSGLIPKNIIYCASSSKLVHEKFGYNKQRGLVIYNGYDLTKFKPFQSHFKISSMPNGIIKIGMVARFDPYKDHANLIESLRLVTLHYYDILVYLVGTNIDHNNNKLLQLIKIAGLDDKIILLGQRDDIPFFMNDIDIHVLSSSAEAFPNVLCEAMSCGIPCVTTDVGDARYIVSDTGWIANPRDSFSLADTICKAIFELKYDPLSFKVRKENSVKRIASEFTIESMVANYSSLWGGKA
ncbi:glycosyl transferase group 1 [Shewanella baltica OS183]|uniref:glycosyltransferase n=1 Tax=Shewanella baltica TaxID=62322 RepID=UPI0001E10F52|nr:glycosyltransferase [Shewanella baltica]EHQ15717.1 glycosyl transferase group 1 [Shewanella baltica OS183]